MATTWVMATATRVAGDECNTLVYALRRDNGGGGKVCFANWLAPAADKRDKQAANGVSKAGGHAEEGSQGYASGS